MKITEDDLDRARAYEAAEPKQFGTLWERMKYTMEIAKLCYDEKAIPADLWHALFDLETEIKYHKPADPPYGRREVKIL